MGTVTHLTDPQQPEHRCPPAFLAAPGMGEDVARRACPAVSEREIPRGVSASSSGRGRPRSAFLWPVPACHLQPVRGSQAESQSHRGPGARAPCISRRGGIPRDQEAQVTDTHPGPWALWRLRSPSLIMPRPGKLTGSIPHRRGSLELGQIGVGLSVAMANGRAVLVEMYLGAHCLPRLDTARAS